MGTFLLSATPSSALTSEKKGYYGYEAKAGRIVDYMKNFGKYHQDGLHQTVYGQYIVMLGYEPKTDDLFIAVWDKDNYPLLDEPDIMMYDRKNNKYGRLDEVYKKNEDGTGRVKIDDKILTYMEGFKLAGLYYDIIIKFYNENEKKMERLENIPEKNQQIEEILDFIKKK